MKIVKHSNIWKEISPSTTCAYINSYPLRYETGGSQEWFIDHRYRNTSASMKWREKRLIKTTGSRKECLQYGLT